MMKIVYMGTPEFAVFPLNRLLASHYPVAAVFTQPDKPKGRGHKLTSPPVKEIALRNEIPVYQPNTLRDGEALTILKEINPDLIIVAAYGKLLPLEILELPKYGCINIHASLLPKYRGAGPIQWSILNGETQTGVTIMYMAEGLDTGDIILKKELSIQPDETADELHDRLAILGADALMEAVPLLESGKVERQKQDDALSCYAPMLSKELSPVDFSKTAQEIHNQIRGLSSWPCAHIMVNGKRLKIYHSTLAVGFSGMPGHLLDTKRFIVGCGNQQGIEFLEVQLEGGKRMSGAEFLRGKQWPLDTELT